MSDDVGADGVRTPNGDTAPDGAETPDGGPAPDGGTAPDGGGTATAGELPPADEHAMPGLGSVERWLTTTNHKDVGVLYIVTSLFFLMFGGVLALLIRAQLWVPGGLVMSGLAYNQTVSTHGLIMVFWFLSPFAFGFANYIVPLQIGAKDLAFPRLNALSYWLYLFSGVLLMISFFQGATFSGGWTMYAPLNIPVYTPQIGASMAVLALLLFTASVTVGGVNFITTIHRMRAKGMTMWKMPLFTWSILLTVWMMLFAFAALLAALVILSSDRLLGTTYFAAESAGGSLLWAHLFWFFGHPEVYIVFFPALGAMAEIFQTFSGRRLVGRKYFIGAMLLVALQSFGVWMHHMFLTSINLEIKTLFMASTIGISLPFDLMVFALIYTMLKGDIRFKTPFLFAFGGLALFILGGITGVFLGAVVLDYEFRGTYWVVAHFHYVMVGGVTGLIAAIYYWFPKITGRMYDEFLGKVQFVLYFVGFNLVYFPMFVVWETPRRVFDYPVDFVPWHRAATVGAFILGFSFLVMFYNLYRSYFEGAEAGDNPWTYGSTAEWAVPSPPPLENFPGIPSYLTGKLSFHDSPEEVTEAARRDRADAATADGGVVVYDDAPEPVHGEGHGDDHAEDHTSIWPFAVGVASLVSLVGLSGLTGGSYPEGATGAFYIGTTVLGGVLLLATLVKLTAENFHGPTMELAERWPFEGVSNMKTGMWVFLASDVVLFGAFIGSYVFIRVANGWTDWHHLVPEAHVTMPGLINTYLLLTSSFAVVLALVAAERGSQRGVVASLVATVLLGVGFLANKAIEWQHLFHVHSEAFPHGWDLSTNVASSTFYLTTGLHGAHVVVGLVIASWMIYRAWNGAYVDGDEAPIEHFGLYWHLVDIVWLFLFPLFYIL